MESKSQPIVTSTGGSTGIQLALPCDSPRLALLRRASGRLPITQEGLPSGFYRLDILPDSPIAQGSQEESDILSAAYIELDYHEGFPALPNRSPFWHRFDYEPAFAYSIFQLYLEQLEEGPRSLAALIAHPEVERSLNGKALPLIQEWYIAYYWNERAKAHDFYREAAYRQVRNRRALYTEDYQYKLADKLMRKLETYLGSDNFWNEMSPKTALEALKVLGSMQRLNSGLSATSPGTGKGGDLTNDEASSNFEMILRQVAKRNKTTTVDEQGGLLNDASLAFSEALSDPRQASVMQELIIRMTTKGSTQQIQQDQGSLSASGIHLNKDITDIEPIDDEDEEGDDPIDAPDVLDNGTIDVDVA